LLVAVILSAQCTDERVNLVTPALFKAFPDPNALAEAPLEEVMRYIQSVNYYKTKSLNIIKTAVMIRDLYAGTVPADLSHLIQLPGVGRKTANVVLGQAFGVPGITVDTHVKRLSQRWGFSTHDDPVRVEQDLMRIWPKETWIDFSTMTILHARQTCKAIKPFCATCLLSDLCPLGSQKPQSPSVKSK
jgi:endonuclease-3